MTNCLIYTALFLGFSLASDACVFPNDLIGSWVSSFRGRTLTFNSTHIEDYWMSDALKSDGFSCYNKTGTQYIVKSVTNHNLVFGNTNLEAYVYVCLEFTKLSDYKQLYYIQTSIYEGDPIFRDVKDPTTMEAVCNTKLATEQYYMMVKSGYENQTSTPIAGDLRGIYNYTVDGKCSESHLDTCTNTDQLTVNLTMCSEKVAFSTNGEFHVLHHIEKNDRFYISLYNRDTTGIDNTNYFQFACLVAEKSGSSVTATARGGYCLAGQNSTGGSQVLVLHTQTFCGPNPPDVDEKKEPEKKSIASMNTVNLCALIAALLLSSLRLIELRRC